MSGSWTLHRSVPRRMPVRRAWLVGFALALGIAGACTGDARVDDPVVGQEQQMLPTGELTWAVSSIDAADGAACSDLTIDWVDERERRGTGLAGPL